MHVHQCIYILKINAHKAHTHNCMPLINVTDLQSDSNLNNKGIACVSIHKPFTA